MTKSKLKLRGWRVKEGHHKVTWAASGSAGTWNQDCAIFSMHTASPSPYMSLCDCCVQGLSSARDGLLPSTLPTKTIFIQLFIPSTQPIWEPGPSSGSLSCEESLSCNIFMGFYLGSILGTFDTVLCLLCTYMFPVLICNVFEVSKCILLTFLFNKNHPLHFLDVLEMFIELKSKNPVQEDCY